MRTLAASMKVATAVVALVLAGSPAAYGVFTDNFNSYINGDMQVEANPPWQLVSPDSAENVTLIENGTVRINSGLNRTAGNQNRDVAVSISESGALITAQIDIKRGGTTRGGNMYSIEFNDTAGRNLARWYGGQNSFAPRIGGTVLAATDLPDDNFHSLRAEINTVTDTTAFYYDNVLQGSLNHAAGTLDVVSQILLRATTRTDFVPEEHVFFDNVSIPEPASILLLGLGGLFALRRRSA